MARGPHHPDRRTKKRATFRPGRREVTPPYTSPKKEKGIFTRFIEQVRKIKFW